jgi:hypothetical protein
LNHTRLVRLVLLVLLSTALVLLPSCAPEVKATKRPPFVRVHIVVAHSTYEYGFLQADGVVQNTGDAPIYSLELRLTIFNQAGDVTLATTTTYPAGCFMAELAPGAKVAFEFIESVPGEPDHVRYSVRPEDPAIIWDIEYPK